MTVSRNNLLIQNNYEYWEPVPFQVDATRLSQGIVEAYAAKFGPGLRAGAFKASLDFHKSCGSLPILSWNCNPADTIGRITAIREDSIGLRVTCQLALNTGRGSIAKQEILMGIDGLSASFEVKARSGNAVSEAHVFDISFMRQAGIPEPEAPEFENSVQFERWLRDQGVAKNAAKKLAAGGWSRLKTPDTSTREDEAAARALSRLIADATFEISTRR